MYNQQKVLSVRIHKINDLIKKIGSTIYLKITQKLFKNCDAQDNILNQG